MDNQMQILRKINPIGIAGSTLLFIALSLSIFYRCYWWEMTVGDGAGFLGFSALNYEVNILGTPVRAVILYFINMVAQLVFVESAVAMFIYSLMPNRRFSENLMKFAYSKPIITLLFFIISLIMLLIPLPATLMNKTLPIVGEEIVSVSIMNVSLDIPLRAGFTITFWLTVTASLLCALAPIYHKEIISKLLNAKETEPNPPSQAEDK